VGTSRASKHWDGVSERLLRRANTACGRVDLLCSRPGKSGKWLLWEVHAYWNGTFGVSLYLSQSAAKEEFYKVVDTLVCREGGNGYTQWVRPAGYKKQDITIEKLMAA
jgi:hypothetical protein